jgi:hypothetical protein
MYAGVFVLMPSIVTCVSFSFRIFPKAKSRISPRSYSWFHGAEEYFRGLDIATNYVVATSVGERLTHLVQDIHDSRLVVVAQTF